MPYFLSFLIFVLVLFVVWQFLFYKKKQYQFKEEVEKIRLSLDQSEIDNLQYQLKDEDLRDLAEEICLRFRSLSEKKTSPKKKQAIQLKRTNLNDVCRDSILHYYEMISTKGPEVQIDIPPEPIYAYSNQEILGHVLSVLILNAMNFGAKGEVIGLSLDSDENNAYIEIWDRGRSLDGSYDECISDRLSPLDNIVNDENESGTSLNDQIKGLSGKISVCSNHAFQVTAYKLTIPKITI